MLGIVARFAVHGLSWPSRPITKGVMPQACFFLQPTSRVDPVMLCGTLQMWRDRRAARR